MMYMYNRVSMIMCFRERIVKGGWGEHREREIREEGGLRLKLDGLILLQTKRALRCQHSVCSANYNSLANHSTKPNALRFFHTIHVYDGTLALQTA